MFDKTFCSNRKCPMKDKCDRSYDRLQEYMEIYPTTAITPISLSHYEPDNPEQCQQLIEIKEKKN